MISPAAFVLAREQLARGELGTSLCSLLAEAAEIAFAPAREVISDRPFRRQRRPT
ncbi:MAG: hypothetical protein SFX73_12140 [Kofleriaceae bacterium]|nr:hypothetical protein [Kofleriaceae bacterium]